MVADNMAAYQSFLTQFTAKLKEINQKNAAIGRIHRQPDFSKSKGAFWFMTCTSALFFIGGSCLFFLPQLGEVNMQGNWEIYLGTIVLGISAFALGFFAWRGVRKAEGKEE